MLALYAQQQGIGVWNYYGAILGAIAGTAAETAVITVAGQLALRLLQHGVGSTLVGPDQY